MSQYRNPNYAPLVRTVEALGGKVTGFRPGRKHFLVFVTTPKGHSLRMTLSKSPMQDGAVEFFTRRTIAKEDRPGNPGGYREQLNRAKEKRK